MHCSVAAFIIDHLIISCAFAAYLYEYYSLGMSRKDALMRLSVKQAAVPMTPAMMSATARGRQVMLARDPAAARAARS
jgi:hypothetical protein